MSVDLTITIRLLLAAALGAAIGYQRGRAGKPAGLRTHILICVGSALFTVASIYGFGDYGDAVRVAAGVVVGVGFLGAGAIIQRTSEGYIAGLTTAATIWIVAGIGMAAGVGLYLAAVVATLIALVVLLLPHRLFRS
ncbi:MAG: MgtC/SapB family protein [Dehalococcoidia bacterium]|nr:MgtC/SapB family protein [Dehalococcoidia bacterium]